MQRDEVYLLDILEAARVAIRHVVGKTRQEFFDDLQCQDAVLHRLVLIGEAARRVSDATRQVHSQLPWKEMVDMRNFLIHEYDDVDLMIVWDTVHQDLPPLVDLLESLMSDAV